MQPARWLRQLAGALAAAVAVVVAWHLCDPVHEVPYWTAGTWAQPTWAACCESIWQLRFLDFGLSSLLVAALTGALARWGRITIGALLAGLLAGAAFTTSEYLAFLHDLPLDDSGDGVRLVRIWATWAVLPVIAALVGRRRPSTWDPPSPPRMTTARPAGQRPGSGSSMPGASGTSKALRSRALRP